MGLRALLGRRSVKPKEEVVLDSSSSGVLKYSSLDFYNGSDPVWIAIDIASAWDSGVLDSGNPDKVGDVLNKLSEIHEYDQYIGLTGQSYDLENMRARLLRRRTELERRKEEKQKPVVLTQPNDFLLQLNALGFSDEFVIDTLKRIDGIRKRYTFTIEDVVFSAKDKENLDALEKDPSRIADDKTYKPLFKAQENISRLRPINEAVLGLYQKALNCLIYGSIIVEKDHETNLLLQAIFKKKYDQYQKKAQKIDAKDFRLLRMKTAGLLKTIYKLANNGTIFIPFKEMIGPSKNLELNLAENYKRLVALEVGSTIDLEDFYLHKITAPILKYNVTSGNLTKN